LLGPLPPTTRGNKNLLIIADRFSKVTRAAPLSNITVATVATAFFNEWITVYGVPLLLLSENGSEFASRFFQGVCASLGVKQLFTSTHHPQCNGQVERFDSTILRKLAHYVSASQEDWDDHVRGIVYGYNCQPHASTGFSPFELVLSRPPTVPILEARPVEPHRSAATKPEFRVSFLHQIAALAGKAM
jgi:transposase InsO family protein